MNEIAQSLFCDRQELWKKWVYTHCFIESSQNPYKGKHCYFIIFIPISQMRKLRLTEIG